jgi:hypothetical protein
MMKDVKKAVQMLRKKYRQSAPVTVSFKAFAMPLLGGEAAYKQFVYSVGYRDFDEQDVEDALYNYGLGQSHTYMRMPWQQLLQKLEDKVGARRIHFGQNVTRIVPVTNTRNNTRNSMGTRSTRNDNEEKNHFRYAVHTDQGPRYAVYTDQGLHIRCKTVVVGADIDTIQRLVPKQVKPLYNRIVGQPFMRVYGHLDASSNAVLKAVLTSRTVVPGLLQKIIPYDVDKGVYMISYCDNDYALRLHNKTDNTAENRAFFERAMEKALDLREDTLHLTEIRAFFWARGTHCYKPTHRKSLGKKEGIAAYRHAVQRPAPHFFVVGEAVGKYHGWCEGAFNSVESVLREMDL